MVDLDFFVEYRIETDDKLQKVIEKNNYVIIPQIDSSMLRIVMLNIGQFVALYYYKVLTNE